MGFATWAKARNVPSAAMSNVKLDLWKLTNPHEFEWLSKNEKFNPFAASLMTQLRTRGMLSEKQVAAIQGSVARSAERKAAAVVAEQVAPVVNEVTKIKEAFARATAKGVARPKMRLGEFVFSKASMTGRNPDAIYVKTPGADGTYLGKVFGTKLILEPAGKPREAEIIAAIADPAAAAIAYGRRTGNCSICGRELTVGESIDRGIGPSCADKYGF